MKICFLILSLFIYSRSFSQTGDRAKVLQLLETQRQDWNRGDIEKFMESYIKSDSLLFVGRSGPNLGWNQTLQNYKKGYPDKAAMGELIFDIKQVRLLENDHAFVLGSWNVRREKDELKGWFTLLLKKIDGSWKIIADHSS